MGLVTIARGTQQFGPYTRVEVLSFLKAGNLVATDLVFDPDARAWMPVEEFLARPVPPPPPRPKRNLAVLLLAAIVGWLVFSAFFYFLLCVITAIVTSALDPIHAQEAGRDAIEWMTAVFGLPVLLLALALSIWLTVIGKLPGTRR